MDKPDKQLNISRAYFLLPFAFLFHNLEEALAMEAWSQKMLSPVQPPVTSKQFAVAAVMITLVGFAAFFSKFFLKSSEKYDFLMTAFAGMIFLNAFFPHLVGTIVFGMYVPGILTALFINLPLTLYIFFANIKNRNLTAGQTVFLILCGGLVGAPTAFLLLQIGASLG
jgi:hypothetical protein